MANERQLKNEEIKKNILEILLEFQTCCQKHGIRFFMSGGTLLGAIRHKGFIPWDDDIDVCMPRPDYERLIKLNREGGILPPHLQLVCFEEGTLSYPFMKVLDVRTRIERQYLAEDDSDCLWIDIFPVEGLPDEEERTEQIYHKAAYYRKLFMLTKARKGTGKTKLKSLGKQIIVPFLKMAGADRFSSRLVQLARRISYEEADYVGAITWGLYGMGERMKKSEFETPFDVSFEGHTFQTMSCWESYLHAVFGDYMQLPPEKDRQTHDMKVWMTDEKNDACS